MKIFDDSVGTTRRTDEAYAQQIRQDQPHGTIVQIACTATEVYALTDYGALLMLGYNADEGGFQWRRVV